MSIDHALRFTGARLALFDLLADLRWHHPAELELAAGNRFGSRLRELKRLGYRIETRAHGDGKLYRLAALEPERPAQKRVRVYLDENDAASVATGAPTLTAVAATRRALEVFRLNRSKL